VGDGPPPTWPLTPAGRAAARRLARLPLFRDVSLVATSPEPKARDTAAPIAARAGLPLRQEDDLREVDRGRTPILARAEYVDLVRRYLTGERVEGWEPPDVAHGRFARCVDRLVAESAGPLAVVSHGLVLSLWLGLSPEEWERIPLPAVAVADAETRRLARPFGQTSS
jgi:broad specificity phosphatase PhoE